MVIEMPKCSKNRGLCRTFRVCCVYDILVQLYNYRSPILLEFIEFLDNSARLTLYDILT